MTNFSNQKENNSTKTADIYYAPSYGNSKDSEKYSIIAYLGINGETAVKMKLGSAQITKVDESNKTLQGAVFGLYAKEDIEIDEETIYKAGKEIERKTTGENGIVKFENLYLGKYEIREIQAPQGYDLQEDTINFEVTNENLEHEFTVENTLKDNPIKENQEDKKITNKKSIKENAVKENLSQGLSKGKLPNTGNKKYRLLLTLAIDAISICIISCVKYKKLV